MEALFPRGRRTCVTVAATVLLASSAFATNVYVDCAPGNPSGSAFTSISAAVASLSGPAALQENWVLLRSDCQENVSIGSGHLRLWIAPEWDPYPWAGSTTNGRLARITSPSATSPVVSITGPSEVTLVHLSVSGGSTGLTITNNAVVALYGVVAENNPRAADGGGGNGISVDRSSTLDMAEGGAVNNGATGIFIGGGSSAVLYGSAPWLQNKPLVVSDNHSAGFQLDRSHMSAWAGVIVRDNGGPGLKMYGADLVFGACCGTEMLVENNKVGMFFSESSEASIWGHTTFRDNGDYGVYAEAGSHVTFYALPTPTDVVENVIAGHDVAGVAATSKSEVSLHGLNRIRRNGSPAQPNSAGIRVDGTSHAFVEKGTEILRNTGPGIWVDLNSSLDAPGALIRNNTGEGIRVRHMSTVDVRTGSDLRPNGAGPLTCDGTSLVVTDLVNRSPACRNVEAPTEPRPPRPEPAGQ